ncbi:MAG: hypothetical protein NDJ94_10300 [Vicinamibacteria bacterium]|nr:hypothetical protein [Vicinamibacteria bacterium]
MKRKRKDRPGPGLPSLLVVIGLALFARTLGEDRYVDPAALQTVVYDETGQVVEPRAPVLFAPQGRVLNPAVKNREIGLAIFTTGLAAAALRRFVSRSSRARGWQTPASRTTFFVAANLNWLALAGAERGWWAYTSWRDDAAPPDDTRFALRIVLWAALPLANLAVWLATRGLWLPVPVFYRRRGLRGALASGLLLPVAGLSAVALFASAWVGDFFSAPFFLWGTYLALATWAAAGWPRPRRHRAPSEAID